MRAKSKHILLLFSLFLALGCMPAREFDSDSVESNSGGAKLVSYYTFDDETADDCSGKEYDGISNSGVRFIDDTPDGKGYSAFINAFKGGFINIPYNVFAGYTSYSIAFWIKDFGSGVIITAVSSDYVRCDFPRLVFTSDNQFRFYTRYDNYNDTPAFESDMSEYISSGWHHIVVTCSDKGSNADRCLYVDGRLIDKDSDGVHAYVNMHGWDEDIIKKVQIGGDRNGAYSVKSSMKIDNVRFYIGAIPLSVVKDLYENKK